MGAELVEEVHHDLAHGLLLVEEAKAEGLETVQMRRQHR